MAKEKKAANTTPHPKPTGYWRVEHQFLSPPGKKQGEVITEAEFRDIPGFATDPKGEDIFAASIKRLVDLGAIKMLTEDETDTAGKPGEAEIGTEPETEPETEPDGLEALSKPDLLKAADEEGVEGLAANANKPDIIAAIRAKRQADQDGSGDGGEGEASDE